MQAAYCGTLTAELNHLATRYYSVSLFAIDRPVTMPLICVNSDSLSIMMLQVLPLLESCALY